MVVKIGRNSFHMARLGQEDIDTADILGVEEVAMPSAFLALGRQGQVRERALSIGGGIAAGDLQIGIPRVQGGNALGGQLDGVLDGGADAGT